jgi:ferredoxin
VIPIATGLKRVANRILPFSKEADEPTYARDIVGEIKRWDERDIVFARADLFHHFGVDSPQYEAYYREHADHLEYDTEISKMPGLGRTGGVDTPMFDAQFDAVDNIGPEHFVDGQPYPGRADLAPERAGLKVKGFARFLGADLVGIGPLRQEWVYSHVGRSLGDHEGFPPRGTPIDLSGHSTAIAMGFAMDYDLMGSAPDFPSLLATAKGYATGAWVSIQLANYIRLMGYSARAHHLRSYQVLCVPVAVDCGLGELSRAGFLISKEFGLGLRLAVVTTDMPLAYGRPLDIAVQPFCKTCRICAEACPIGAIPEGDKIEHNGVKKWELDEERCYRYWHAVGTDCAICMVSCPWTKHRSWFHRTAAELASVIGPHQSLMVKADKLFYGQHEPEPRPDFIDSPEC